MSTDTAIRPNFHHFNLKTTRLQELIDWYTTVVGAEVTFQDSTGAWLTNDGANHRIALLCFPGFVDDPDRETRTGMHHSAFEYDSFGDLNDSYLRLRDAGTASKEWMRTSPDFHANPIGVFVNPTRIAEAAACGETLAEIHRRAMA